MTLTNPYDKPPKKALKDYQDQHQNTHHAVIHRKNAVELCHYADEAYKPQGEQLSSAKYIEHSVFGMNDIQCVIYTKGDKKIVAFRGTQESTDWITDLNTISIRLSQVFPFITEEYDLYAHRGFTKSLQPIYEDIKNAIIGSEYDLTGHSLGAGLATIFGYVYALESGVKPTNFYTFGSPRVFLINEDLPTTRYDDLLEMVRIQNDNDVISYYPQKGGYEAVAKHGGAGAVAGALLGSVGGGLGMGALLGAVGGAGIGVASGGYTHVGTGMILFEDINTVVYTATGGRKLLKDRNYFLMPEGTDTMRDPLDITSTLTQKLGGMGVIESAFELVRRLYSKYSGFADFLDEGRRDGVIARARNIYNVNFMNRMRDNIVMRIAQSRHTLPVLQRNHLVYHAERMKSLTGRIYARPAEYLTGELLDRYNLMGDNMLRASASWMGRMTYEEAGFTQPITQPILDDLSSVFHREVIGMMNEQLIVDTAVAKQFYKMLGLSMVVETALVGYAGYDIYTKTVGHKLRNYNRRLRDLPETIYEGFAKQDTLYSPDATFKQINDNVYFSDGQYYYLTHHRDKTTLRPMIQKIYGYILYSPEEEAEHVNKLICF